MFYVGIQQTRLEDFQVINTLVCGQNCSLAAELILINGNVKCLHLFFLPNSMEYLASTFY